MSTLLLPDVNILVGAFRVDNINHGKCRPWLETAIRIEQPIALSELTLAAVIRIATNWKTHKPPSELREAIGYCNYLKELGWVMMIEPGPHHWAIFTSLLAETNTVGSATTDAYLAALAIEHDCTFVTLDRDSARFPNLEWIEPV